MFDTDSPTDICGVGVQGGTLIGMTNGEKFKEVFQISQVDEGELYAYVWLPNHDAAEFSIDWWNAEYKEPTTKNNLGVDLISRADALDCVNWGYCFSDIYKKINELPSVYPKSDKPSGKWEAIPKYPSIAWKCSNCGHFTTTLYKHYYCCECGAKMVEPQESEDTK